MDLNLLWIETVYIGLYIGLYRKVSLKLSLYAWCVEQKSSLPLITIIRRDWYVKVEFLVFYQTGPVRRKRYKWEENTQKMLIELSKLSQYNQNTETRRKSNSGETIFKKKNCKGSQTSTVSLEENNQTRVSCTWNFSYEYSNQTQHNKLE